jgi:hypothetical protein
MHNSWLLVVGVNDEVQVAPPIVRARHPCTVCWVHTTVRTCAGCAAVNCLGISVHEREQEVVYMQ